MKPASAAANVIAPPSALSTPAATAATASRQWILGAILVVVTVGLRLPLWNDHILFIDEPYYHSVAARLTVPGTVIYPDAHGQAPPLGPVSFLATVTYALAITISPAHAILVVHLFTTLAICVTTLLLLYTSICFLDAPWAGFCAGLLYALVGTSDSGREMFFGFSGLEHFQAPFLAAFVFAFLRAVQRQHLRLAAAAGVCLGIAALYKINVLTLLPLPWVVAAITLRRGSLDTRRAAVLATVTTLAALATFGVVPLYYAATGRFGSWRAYNINMLITYATMGETWAERARGLALAIPLEPFLFAGLLYGALTAARKDRATWAGELGGFLTLTWLVLFTSLTPGQRKPHYLIQALPAECLLIGMVAVAAWHYVTRPRVPSRPYLTALGAMALVFPLAYAAFGLIQGWLALAAYAGRDAYLDLHRQHGTLAPLVRHIQQQTGATDLIYVHSEAPELYFLTQRATTVNDPVGSWIANMPSSKLADSLLAELQAAPPRLIVQLDYRRYGWRAGETLEKWPQLASWVHHNYRESGHIPHAQVLERRDATVPLPAAAQEVALSSLAPEAAVQSAGWLRFDRNQSGQSLRMNGRTYESGISTRPASRLTYRLDGAYRAFTADVGIDAAVEKRGSAVFTVEVDGVAKFTSPLLHGGAPPLPIEVDVSGARTMSLVVGPARQSNADDWADWAQARLIRAGP